MWGQYNTEGPYRFIS